MRIIAEGEKNGRRERLTWDLSDTFDRATQATSMSRTTAFPCTIMARQILAGAFKKPGVHPPEHVGMIPGLLDSVFAQLQSRGVTYTRRTDAI
jgi:saccharopine dehydrogenase-like NADP-dependent oxidoreductase